VIDGGVGVQSDGLAKLLGSLRRAASGQRLVAGAQQVLRREFRLGDACQFSTPAIQSFNKAANQTLHRIFL
jgi:hypothetical protein